MFRKMTAETQRHYKLFSSKQLVTKTTKLLGCFQNKCGQIITDNKLCFGSRRLANRLQKRGALKPVPERAQRVFAGSGLGVIHVRRLCQRQHRQNRRYGLGFHTDDLRTLQKLGRIDTDLGRYDISELQNIEHLEQMPCREGLIALGEKMLNRVIQPDMMSFSGWEFPK